MTGDVNAAIAGARSAMATDIAVEENHGTEMQCNLLLDEIAPAAIVRFLAEQPEQVRGYRLGGGPPTRRSRTHTSCRPVSAGADGDASSTRSRWKPSLRGTAALAAFASSQ